MSNIDRTTAFAVAWFAAVGLMALHIVGELAGMWGTGEHWTWSLALVFLVVLGVLSTLDYWHERTRRGDR